MKIASYAYLHVTGWQMMLICQLCLLQLLHKNDTDCLRLDLVSSRFCRANLSYYTCPHISCSGIDLDTLSPLQIISVFSSWTLTHMPVDVIKTCSFITATLSSKYRLLCSTRCHHFSVNHQVYSKTTKWKLKLTLIYYSAVDI